MLAPATRHEAEELRVEKRHQMMEGVPVCLFVHLFTGVGGSRLGRRDPIHTSSDEGPNHKPMWRADRRRGGDRDVRGWFASSHRG